MNSIQLFSAIIRGKCLFDPHFAISQGSIIALILNRKTKLETLKPDPLSSYAIVASNPSGVKYSDNNSFDKVHSDSIAVISLKGALMKTKQSCAPLGMATILHKSHY
jgi:hypothetical protein